MKVTLKLGEEKNGLKLIQVNDGFVVVDLKSQIVKNDWYMFNLSKLGEYGYEKFHSDYRKFNKYQCAKIIFTTPNLSLEGVPVIENNEFFTFSKQQLRFLFDTSLHAKIGKLNQNEEFERVLVFLNKQVQQNLFTEEQVREAIQFGVDNCHYGLQHETLNKENQINSFIQSLRQPKVEITFEEDKIIKCVML